MRGSLSVLVLLLLAGCAGEVIVVFKGAGKTKAAEEFVTTFQCPEGFALTGRRNGRDKSVVCQEIVP